MEKQAEKLSVKVYTLQDDQEMQMMNKEVRGDEEQVKVCRQRGDQELYLLLSTGPAEAQHLTLQDGEGVSVIQFSVSKETDCCRVGSQSLLVTVGNLSILLQFQAHDDMQKFNRLLRGVIGDCNDDDEDIDGVDHDEGSKEGCNKVDKREDKDGCNNIDKREDKDGEMEISMGGESFQEAYRRHPSVFAQSTEDSYAPRCSQFHGCLSQQQNTLQDYMRTATYHRAILLNETDFRDKVVLNVGCGSAILSFFAVQAGAKKVYAVETSPMAKYAQVLVQNNRLSDRVVVLEGKVEDVNCPEMVDVIISEPIGYMLLSERTLESFLYARKWLRPNGLMFPSSGDIHLAPFTDEQLYIEHYTRASFWHQRCFYGINLSGLHSAAVDEFFRQPIMDTFDMQILMSRSVKYTVNFLEAKEEELRRVEIPFVFTLFQSGLVHGLAFWFDVAFQGSSSTVWLSTAPSEPLTHWYQVRCLLQTPLFAKLGQTLSGTVVFTDNKRRSYDIHITAMVNESGFRSGNTLDLKNPFFRYM